MLPRIQIEDFKDTSQKEEAANLVVSWSRVKRIAQFALLLAFPVTFIALSILNDFLFFKELASATILITLLLFVRLAGGES